MLDGVETDMLALVVIPELLSLLSSSEEIYIEDGNIDNTGNKKYSARHIRICMNRLGGVRGLTSLSVSQIAEYIDTHVIDSEDDLKIRRRVRRLDRAREIFGVRNATRNSIASASSAHAHVRVSRANIQELPRGDSEYNNNKGANEPGDATDRIPDEKEDDLNLDELVNLVRSSQNNIDAAENNVIENNSTNDIGISALSHSISGELEMPIFAVVTDTVSMEPEHKGESSGRKNSVYLPVFEEQSHLGEEEQEYKVEDVGDENWITRRECRRVLSDIIRAVEHEMSAEVPDDDGVAAVVSHGAVVMTLKSSKESLRIGADEEKENFTDIFLPWTETGTVIDSHASGRISVAGECTPTSPPGTTTDRAELVREVAETEKENRTKEIAVSTLSSAGDGERV
eukprot:gene28045-36200_t